MTEKLRTEKWENTHPDKTREIASTSCQSRNPEDCCHSSIKNPQSTIVIHQSNRRLWIGSGKED
jgi:hypothetical protein